MINVAWRRCIREPQFDFYCGGGRVREDVFGPEFCFLPRRDPVFLFASNTKRTIAFTPAGYFFRQDRVLEIFFKYYPPPIKFKWWLLKFYLSLDFVAYM